MIRLLRRLVVRLLVVLILLFAIGSWFGADFLIGPAPSKVSWPTHLGYSPEEVSFSATDGIPLKGWFLSSLNCTKTVILLHGVRDNRDSMLPRALWLHSLGYNVFAYDARGCGESAHVMRSFGWYETRDLLGALAWLQGRGMTEVACLGCSQGAATILLASGQLPENVKAVVSEASYATLRHTTDDHFKTDTGFPSYCFGVLVVPIAEWKLGLNMDDVLPVQEIGKLKVPIYMIGGTADTLAPPQDTQKMYESASCEKNLWMVKGAGHADFFSYAGDEYKQRVGDFLSKHL